MKISEARGIVTAAFKAKLATFIWGGPGIGKSELIEQIGKTFNRPVIDIRLVLCDPTDLKGIPFYCPETNTMKWATPADMPQVGNVTENAILFLDELNSAPPSTQAAAYQLVLNRRIGEYVLPQGVDIVAAGNRESDRGVVYKMPTPLANRFIHVDLEVDFEEWQNWAVESNMHADVIGFLSHHKHKLYDFEPTSNSRAFPTPRSWSFVSKLMATGLSGALLKNAVMGAVGEGVALEFSQHLEVAAKMPLPEDVLEGKVSKLEIDEISAKYSLIVSMCYTLKSWSTTKTQKEMDAALDNFFRFTMDNTSPEMNILGARTLMGTFKIQVNPGSLKNFDEFFKKVGKYVLN